MIRQFIFAILIGLMPAMAQGSDSHVNYAGHYEMVGKDPARVFQLNLIQKGSRVHVSFYAADRDAAGVQPKGEGDGRVNDEGVLQFNFKDNLATEGTAIFKPIQNNYLFEMRVTKFKDPTPLHFYGVLTMKKMSNAAPTGVAAD